MVTVMYICRIMDATEYYEECLAEEPDFILDELSFEIHTKLIETPLT